MLEAMLEGWRGKRVLIVGDRGGLCAFLIAVLDEIGARPVCVSDRADAQTLCRALTAGRVSAAILPGEMTGRSLPERLEATLTLTREVREAGVPLLLAMSDAAVYRGGGRMNEAGEIGGRTREGMEASILQTALLGAADGLVVPPCLRSPTVLVQADAVRRCPDGSRPGLSLHLLLSRGHGTGEIGKHAGSVVHDCVVIKRHVRVLPEFFHIFQQSVSCRNRVQILMKGLCFCKRLQLKK